MLVLGREAVDTRSENRLDGRWNLDRDGIFAEPVRPTLTNENLRLNERPDAFLEEQWVPFRSLDQQTPERAGVRIVTKQSLQESFGAVWRKRIDPELPV